MKSFSEYVSYSYNHKGVRFAKTNGPRSINYYLDGTKILGEDHNDGKQIRYFYDITGLAGFTLNEVKYHYVKDLQGNIVRIHNASGQLVCKYYYDAWGNTTIHDENGNVITNNLANADHVAIINPFRYRSYYYDNETGYYFLQTRYYDPQTGRFISPDTIDYLDPTDINGLDLYCYCLNNPVMYVDPSGHAWWHWLIGAAVVALLVAGTILSAGGLAGGLLALGAAANGIASASLLTTVLAFGAVGAGTVLAASAIAAGVGAIETWATGGSFSDGINSAMDYGEVAMWGTISGGAFGALGGYVSHREQYPNSHYKILKVGRINGIMRSGDSIEGYPGVRYRTMNGKIYSVELHPNHNAHGIHLQKNQWFLNHPKYPGKYVLNPHTFWRWRLW